MVKKIIIVEDEALIADHLSLILAELGHEVVGIADDSATLLPLLNSNPIDLVLLDIQLAGHLDGVDLAHLIESNYRIPYIFITSNSDPKTLERVKLTNAAGFITKPFSKSQLSSNIALLQQAEESAQNMATVNEEAFFIKENHTLVRVNYQDVQYVEASDNYAILYTITGRFVLSQTLKTVEAKLANHGFLRTHRSYLVNLKHITKVEPRTVFIGEISVPLSESARNELLEKLNLF